MNPVIKKSPYHHVLLMRDDKEVVSFKVHSKVLWYSLAGSVLLIALGVSGTIFGVKSWQKNHSLKARYQSTVTELADARLQLEQLSNLQTLIATSDSPAPVFKFNEIQMPLQPNGNSQPNEAGQEGPGSQGGNALPTDSSNGSPSASGSAEVAEPSTEAAQTETGNAGNIPSNSVEGKTAANDSQPENSPNDEASTGNAVTKTDNAAPSAETNNQKETGDNADSGPNDGHSAEGKTSSQGAPQNLPITHDTSPVRINNLVSKATSKNRLQLSYDLVTSKQDAFVRGLASYQIELISGAKHDIEPNFSDDSRFAISRMKNFDLTANLPKDIQAAQIKNVLVHVTLDSGETFTSRYPFAQ